MRAASSASRSATAASCRDSASAARPRVSAAGCGSGPAFFGGGSSPRSSQMWQEGDSSPGSPVVRAPNVPRESVREIAVVDRVSLGLADAGRARDSALLDATTAEPGRGDAPERAVHALWITTAASKAPTLAALHSMRRREGEFVTARALPLRLDARPLRRSASTSSLS
jgi:hypothetical protein